MTNTEKNSTSVSVNKPSPTETPMPSSESSYIPSLASFETKSPPFAEAPTNTPATEDNLAPISVTIESKKQPSSFKRFVIAGLAVILLIYSGVFYLYFQNKSLKDLVSSKIPKFANTLTPTPIFSPDKVMIDNGNVTYKNSAENSTILINKEAYPATGITGFARVSVSPDNKLLCFESIPPSTKPTLYLSDSSGNNIREVGPNRSKCLWKSDAKQIFYIGKVNSEPNVNIFAFDIASSTEQILTKNAPSLSKPDYNLIGLSSDESNIICSYYDAETNTNVQCQVDLTTGTFTKL